MRFKIFVEYRKNSNNVNDIKKKSKLIQWIIIVRRIAYLLLCVLCSEDFLTAKTKFFIKNIDEIN